MIRGAGHAAVDGIAVQVENEGVAHTCPKRQGTGRVAAIEVRAQPDLFVARGVQGGSLEHLPVQLLPGGDHQVVRHRDLVPHAVDGDLQPLLGGEGPMGGKRPRAVFSADGEQARVADRSVGDLARQPHGGQHLVKRHLRVAPEHVFQIVIGKFHGVEGEALRLHHGGHRVLFIDLQLFRRVLDVIDAGGQVFVGHLRHREGHADGPPVGGLQFVALGVQHADVEGVADRHVGVAVAHGVHGGLRPLLLIQGHAPHVQRRVRGEHAGVGLDRDDHVAHDAALVKGGLHRPRVLHGHGLDRLDRLGGLDHRLGLRR